MANCKFIIEGKSFNGNDSGTLLFEVPDTVANSGIENIIAELGENRINVISDFLNKQDKNKSKIFDISNSDSNYAKHVIGNYNSSDFVEKMQWEIPGFKLNAYTKSLLDSAKAIFGDLNFILYSKLDYTADSSVSEIKGALLRRSLENPLIMIKGTDKNAIQNTLTHELTHLLFDKIISSDPELQQMLYDLLDSMTNRLINPKKGDSISELAYLIDTIHLIKSPNKANEIFAYLFQDTNSYFYIKNNFPNEFNKLNNLIELVEPSGIIKTEKIIYKGMPSFNTLPDYTGNTMTYAGIGSRETPPNILALMSQLAKDLESKGYTLNTGDAKAADQAFRQAVTKKNVFSASDATDFTLSVASEIHPKFEILTEYAQKLQARNINQIFGAALDTPVDFVICWTPLNKKGEAVDDYTKRDASTGGTGLAIEMASRKGIPVINLADPNALHKLEEILKNKNDNKKHDEDLRTNYKPKPSKLVFNGELQTAIDNAKEFIRNSSGNKFMIIEGKAGTGKTTIVPEILEEFPNKSVCAAALSNKAKSVISSKLKDAGVHANSLSLAKLLGLKEELVKDPYTGNYNSTFVKDPKATGSLVSSYDIIIVDEASMVNEEFLEMIMSEKRADAKVIFIGDKGQLGPIRDESSKFYKSLGNQKYIGKKSPVFDENNKYSDNKYRSKLLTRVRQGEGSPILSYADYYWNHSLGLTNDNATTLIFNNRSNNIQDTGAIIFSNNVQNIKSNMLEAFKHAKDNQLSNYIKYVAYTNKKVKEINTVIHEYLFGANSPKYNKGEMIIFTRGVPNFVENSTEAIITSAKLENINISYGSSISSVKAWKLQIEVKDDPILSGETITVLDDSEVEKHRQKMNLWADEIKRSNNRAMWGQFYRLKETLLDIDYSYAITSHKSQGSTYDITIVDEQDIMSVKPTSELSKSESIYTALTRPKNMAVVISSKPVNAEDSRINFHEKNININNLKNVPVEVEAEALADPNVFNSFEGVGPSAIPYQESGSLDINDMMPHLQYDKETKTFTNIDEAYQFFEKYKGKAEGGEIGLANVWHETEMITTPMQIMTAKAGDLVRMSSLDYVGVPKKGDVGLFGPAFWYGVVMQRDVILKQITENLNNLEQFKNKLNTLIYEWNKSLKDEKYKILPLTDELFDKIVAKQIEYKSQYFEFDKSTGKFKTKIVKNGQVETNEEVLTANGKKYLNNKPNYILARTFFDKKSGKFKGYVAVKFKGKKEASAMIVDLSPENIEGIRRMDDTYRQEYSYENGEIQTDEKGNPVIKQKSAKYSLSTISKEEHLLIDANLNTISQVFPELDSLDNLVQKQVDPLIKLITFSNGSSKYVATKLGVMVSGFYGLLGDALKTANTGDWIKYIDSRVGKTVNSSWGVKVMNLPGGSLIKTLGGELKVVTSNNVSSVVYSKENLTRYLKEVSDLVDETKQLAKSKIIRDASKNKNFSIFPFWDTSNLDMRKSMALNLKKGDIIKIMFKTKDGAFLEMYAPVLFVTSNQVYYGTGSEDFKIQSVDVSAFTEGKWVKNKDTWEFSGKESYKKPFIRAAYRDHREYKNLIGYFNEYSKKAKELSEQEWERAERTYVPLEELTRKLIGTLKNERSYLQGKDISTEWSRVDFENADDGFKSRKLANLIEGDLIKTTYEIEVNGNVESRSKWGMVVGKDPVTLEPIVAITDRNGKLIVRKRSYDKITMIAERYLPIYINNETGEYSNFEQEGFTKLSDGRPMVAENIRSRFEEFFESGLSYVTVNESEKNTIEQSNKLKGISHKWSEMIPVTIDGEETWVLNFDAEKMKKRATDEKMFRLQSNRSSGKNYSLRKYQMENRPLYGAYKSTFEDILSIAKTGDIIEIEVTKQDGSKMYVPGMISTVSNSAIEISAIRVNKENGERLYSSDTYNWFKPKNGQTSSIKVLNFYGQDLDSVFELGRLLMNREKTDEVKLSKDRKKTKRSYDNFETIKVTSERLTSLYGVTAHLVTDSEMLDALRSVGSTVTTARAFAKASTGEIFINVDKASIAEPLHELSHILLPGLKSKNINAYNALMSKIKQHPDYNSIAELYPELKGLDLDEEVFVTIFAEYFREKTLSDAKNDWLSEDFTSFSDNVESVASELFDSNIKGTAYDLMGLTLEELMDEFGTRLLSGRFKQYYDLGVVLSANSLAQKIYFRLIDSGKLKKTC